MSWAWYKPFCHSGVDPHDCLVGVSSYQQRVVGEGQITFYFAVFPTRNPIPFLPRKT